MAIRTLHSLLPSLRRQAQSTGAPRVLVRADLNAPLTPDGRVSDVTRLAAAGATLSALQHAGAATTLTSHLGRDGGSLAPVAAALAELYPELNLTFLDEADLTSGRVARARASLAGGSTLLLENTRSDGRDSAGDEGLAAALGSGADVFVADAFGTAHRAHASNVGVAAVVPHTVAGYCMAEEVLALDPLVHPDVGRPYVAVIGGAKVSSKLPLLHSLIDSVDALAIGGGMAFTFLAAQGMSLGATRVESDLLDAAADILYKARDAGVPLVLPVDTVTDSGPDPVPVFDMAAQDVGYDIGPASVAAFADVVAGARTVFWNGPMGMAEVEAYSHGTHNVGRAIAALGDSVFTVVGGGDSVAAVTHMDIHHDFSHVSTGGGAVLEYIQKAGALPGIDVCRA